MKTILPSTSREANRAWPSFALLSLGGVGAVVTAFGFVLGLPAALAFLLGFAASTAVVFSLRERFSEAAGSTPASIEPPLRMQPREPAARSVMDALPSPLLVIAESGRVVLANRAARESLPRLVIGAPYAHSIRAPEFVEAVAAAMADGAERTILFAANPARERTLRARISAVPSGDAFGEGARLIVQIEDRTEAHRAEQLRSDFIANASHELRTPLASIIGYIETLQHHAKDDPEARERFLGIMERQAGRMQRLVDDLMSLSRIELSEHLRPDEPCSLTAIAAEAASALLPVAKAENVELVVDVPERNETVLGDRDQLYQVFANLLDNAIKYSGAGTTVRVQQAPSSRAFPGKTGVTVKDTGPGISREHLPRLTERFYRVDTGQSRNKGGTGLGLAIVKHIVNRHEGKLEIISALNKGSAFTVWLPRSGEADRESAITAPVVTKSS